MSTETETRPSLAHLPLDVQLRIEVAETQGFAWNNYPGGWWLETEADIAAILWPDGTLEWMEPDPLTDPAAWGALAHKERTDILWSGGGDFVTTVARHCIYHFHPDEVGWAVCLAVLAKHGRDTSRYTETQKP